MEDIMLIRSSFLRRIISQVINKMLKKQLPGTEVQLGEVQANWSEKEQMKKLFISVPMKGRTEAQIRATMEQMHHIAEAVFGEELEVIQTYISDDPPADANQAVWYLGESIKKMADADYFIGIYDEEKAFRGCAIENLVARSYNIPSYVINFGFVAPDVTEARAKANRKYNSYY